MLLVLSLRTTVALAVALAPTAAPDAGTSARDYAGADQAAAPGDAAPAIVPAPAATTPPMDAQAPAEEGAHVVTPPPIPAPIPAPIPPPTPAPGVAATPEGPAEEDEVLPYDPLVDSPEAIRARHWVRSGIVFVVVGAVLTGGAIAMSQAEVNNPDTGAMPCNNRGDPAGNGCTAGGRERATAALAVPGALLLAGGAAMLTVGKLQQKRLAANLSAGLSAGLSVGRRGFQLGVTLRF